MSAAREGVRRVDVLGDDAIRVMDYRREGLIQSELLIPRLRAIAGYGAGHMNNYL